MDAEQIKQDRQAVENYSRLLAAHNVAVLTIDYEDFFAQGATDDHSLEWVNTVLRFLQYEPIHTEVFQDKWKDQFNDGSDRFSSVEAYRLIPGIESIEEEVGSDEDGWLFR